MNRDVVAPGGERESPPDRRQDSTQTIPGPYVLFSEPQEFHVRRTTSTSSHLAGDTAPGEKSESPTPTSTPRTRTRNPTAATDDTHSGYGLGANLRRAATMPQNENHRNTIAATSETLNHSNSNNNPLPPLPPAQSTLSHPVGDLNLIVNGSDPRPGPGIDWIVPVRDQTYRERTFAERLQPTLDTAQKERAKYARKAKMTGYALNIAIGLQVVFGALTTGLSAVTSGRQTSIMTSILGGLSTIVASYLARARGSNEPELSIARCKDLEQFIRECLAFQMDSGHMVASAHPECDERLEDFRRRFEELLGNANGERRLAPPV